MESSYRLEDGNDDVFVIKRSNSDDSSSSSVVVDSMVTATKRCNTWVVDYCTMCTEYMDKQVQYEIMAARFQGAAEAASATLRGGGPASSSAAASTTDAGVGAATFDLQGTVASCHQNFDDIKATAAMMFDEASVVESVDGR